MRRIPVVVICALTCLSSYVAARGWVQRPGDDRMTPGDWPLNNADLHNSGHARLAEVMPRLEECIGPLEQWRRNHDSRLAQHRQAMAMREAAAQRLVFPDLGQRVDAARALGLLRHESVDAFGKICEFVRRVSARNDRDSLEPNTLDMALTIGTRRRLFDDSVARCRRHKS